MTDIERLVIKESIDVFRKVYSKALECNIHISDDNQEFMIYVRDSITDLQIKLKEDEDRSET